MVVLGGLEEIFEGFGMFGREKTFKTQKIIENIVIC